MMQKHGGGVSTKTMSLMKKTMNDDYGSTLSKIPLLRFVVVVYTRVITTTLLAFVCSGFQSVSFCWEKKKRESVSE